MTKFNNNLNNLFKNYQQQQTYTKYEKAKTKDKNNKSLWTSIDLNKDDKITAADKTKINENKNSILNTKNLFDVNGDGKLNQNDIDMFVKGDVNGDGKVSKEEKAFVDAYKSQIIKAFNSQKVSFAVDKKTYVNGGLANGVVGGKYYKDGVLASGVATSQVLKSVSGCNINTVTNYDKSGNQTSQQIKVTQQANGVVYMLPAISGLDPSKITKVSSNADGSFTVTSDGFEYNYNRQSVSGKTYNYTAKSKISKTLATVSGCNINTVTNYDKNGNQTSQQIKVTQKANGVVYMLPAINGLDPSKIAKVSSNADGSFTVTAGDKKYVYTLKSSKNNVKTYSYKMTVKKDESTTLNKDGSISVKSKTLAQASGCNISTLKTYDKNGKLTQNNIVVYQTANKMTYTLPATSGLDPSKIAKVSSNKDSSFTINVGETRYIYAPNSSSANNKKYSFITKLSKNDEIEHSYGYVSDGKPYYYINIARKNENGEEIKTERFDYKKGQFNERSEKVQSGNKTVTCKYDKNNKLIDKCVLTLNHDSNGKLISSNSVSYGSNNVKNLESVTLYDPKTGNRTKHTASYYEKGKKVREAVSIYDNDGNIKTQTGWNKNSNGSSSYEFEYKNGVQVSTKDVYYDKNSKKISESSSKVDSKTGKKTSENIYYDSSGKLYSKDVATYDKNFKLIEKIYYDYLNKKVIVYGSNGKVKSTKKM